MTLIMAPIGVGELLDKITILEIKLANTNKKEKVKNISHELLELQNILDKLVLPENIFSLKAELKETNSKIWNLEDKKRIFINKNIFGDEFVKYAIEVLSLNDKRCFIKKQINIACDSNIVEEKIYTNYDI